MSDKADGKADGADGQADGTDPVWLANALRFERAKNKVLLDEVIALEDEVVNRCMADFDAVVSDETREFWREQLLANREAATRALQEVVRARDEGGGRKDEGGGMRDEGGRVKAELGQERSARRPLHNRALARPVVPGVASGSPSTGSGQAGDADDRAAKIRNRAHEISKGERIPFSAAFRRAEKELAGK